MMKIMPTKMEARLNCNGSEINAEFLLNRGAIDKNNAPD